MAVVLIEGFESAQASKLALKGWTGSLAPSLVTGRHGGSACRIGSTSSRQSRGLPSSYTTVIAGFAVKWDTTPTADIFRLLNGTTMVAALAGDGAGHVRVLNSSSVQVAVGTAALAPLTWVYLELKVVIAGASGSCEVRVNGVTDIPATTVNLGSTAINAMQLFVTSSDYDDIYVADTSGSAPRNTFLGDVRVATLFPAGAGATSQWTPLAGANYAAVDEAATTWPDDDTTYVSDSTPGHVDTYTFGDLPVGATAVYGVQVNMYARKDDAGTRTIAPVIRQGSTDYPGSSVGVAASYAYLAQIYNQDPVGADWTPANVNADEYGIQEIA